MFISMLRRYCQNEGDVKLTADIPLHKCASRKNACPQNRSTLLDDIISQSELTRALAYSDRTLTSITSKQLFSTPEDRWQVTL